MTTCLARRAAPGATEARRRVPPGVLELHRRGGAAAFPFELWWRPLTGPWQGKICAVAATEAEGRAHLDHAAALAEACAA